MGTAILNTFTIAGICGQNVSPIQFVSGPATIILSGQIFKTFTIA
jgi:hypothetical protein